MDLDWECDSSRDRSPWLSHVATSFGSADVGAHALGHLMSTRSEHTTMTVLREDRAQVQLVVLLLYVWPLPWTPKVA